jgi:hypothetical protein
VDMCSGVFGHDFPPGFLALAMAVLFTLGMASSVMRGVCRKEEAAAVEETKALLGDSKYGATEEK